MTLQRALALAMMALDECHYQTLDPDWLKARVFIKKLLEEEKEKNGQPGI